MFRYFARLCWETRFARISHCFIFLQYPSSSRAEFLPGRIL
jgi:hypothetical protein